MDHRFQIDLRGIISLLSDHLYSSPQVYLRELLQNAVDAITARRQLEPNHPGEVRVELLLKDDGSVPTLVFCDDGVGLTEPEVHEFLATIGQSSKRAVDGAPRVAAEAAPRNDYIGQFGIGLLSCFVVSDEIVVITRSAREAVSASGESPGVEWRGRHDGTYSVRLLHGDERPAAPGTQVYLRGRGTAAEYFEPERVQRLLTQFGSLLPHAIFLTIGGASSNEHHGETTRINAEPPPWRRSFASAHERREAMLKYGAEIFGSGASGELRGAGEEFFDYVPLRAEAGDAEGVAFVLAYSPNLATKRTHRVYLKNMLLSESAEGLLPEWAFFVKCVINANGLRPTASRESFYEDEALVATRESLGKCLRDWLIGLATEDPVRLQKLIQIHGLSIKALALHDDEFFALFARWLPFETTLGVTTLGEYLQHHPVVRYVRTVDHFRQIARVAAAQGMPVVNGGYTYDSELLERLPQVLKGARVEQLDPADVAHTFEDLTVDQREQVHRFVRIAELVLQPFKCSAEMKRFKPDGVPTLYGAKSGADLQRAVQASREVSDKLWSSMMDGIMSGADGTLSTLTFNYENALIRRLAGVTDKEMLKLVIEMLYVQALLLGQQPLHGAEMELLHRGLLGLIECGLEGRDTKRDRGDPTAS